MATKQSPAARKPFSSARENNRKRNSTKMPSGQQWSSIMWDIIIGLIYRQYARNYLAAARKQWT
jgi:hypothetical protein